MWRTFYKLYTVCQLIYAIDILCVPVSEYVWMTCINLQLMELQLFPYIINVHHVHNYGLGLISVAILI